MIGLCGCVAQQEGEAALDRAPELDFVLGPARVGELGKILARRRAGERVVATGLPGGAAVRDRRDLPGRYLQGDGDLHRGVRQALHLLHRPDDPRRSERCRPMAEILEEVRHLVEYGFREIELLGQTINHWREPAGPSGSGEEAREDFAHLLHAVAEIPGVERLRFITSYPRDFTARMIEAFASHETICPYLHLPVQSGSNPVLRRMGRGYTVEAYPSWSTRSARRGRRWCFSTDLIVGFPGETEEQFRGDAGSGRAGPLRLALRLQVLPPPGHGGAAARRRRAGGGGEPAGERAVRGPDRDPARAQRGAGGGTVGGDRHGVGQGGGLPRRGGRPATGW